ncbi:hypothetical protein Tco_0251582 [Tanacetum coccineum]
MKLKKALDDFDSHQEKRLSSLRTQLGQQQDNMTGKINLLWKNVSEKLNDAPIPESAENFMASKNIASISLIEREELRRNGIKIPSKLFSPKYLSPASIIEVNKNPSAPKRVHFVNSIVILSKESEAEEGETTTDITPEHGHNITKEAKEEVKEVIDEEESEVETDEEVEEILEDEEEEGEDEDDEYFNLFPTMEELTHHEWLLKNPRPPFAYKCDFMILEDTTSIIDRHLGEMAFGRPFIDETGLSTTEKKERIDFIPPSTYEETLGHGMTHYYQSLLIGDEYMQDGGDRRGIRHLIRLEKEMMGDKGEVA